MSDNGDVDKSNSETEVVSSAATVAATTGGTPTSLKRPHQEISNSEENSNSVGVEDEDEEEDEEEDEDDSLSAPKVNNIKKRRTGETNGKSNDVDAEAEDVHDEDDEEDDEDDEGDEEEVADEEDDEEDEDE